MTSITFPQLMRMDPSELVDKIAVTCDDTFCLKCSPSYFVPPSKSHLSHQAIFDSLKNLPKWKGLHVFIWVDHHPFIVHLRGPSDRKMHIDASHVEKLLPEHVIEARGHLRNILSNLPSVDLKGSPIDFLPMWRRGFASSGRIFSKPRDMRLPFLEGLFYSNITPLMERLQEASVWLSGGDERLSPNRFILILSPQSREELDNFIIGIWDTSDSIPSFLEHCGYSPIDNSSMRTGVRADGTECVTFSCFSKATKKKAAVPPSLDMDSFPCLPKSTKKVTIAVWPKPKIEKRELKRDVPSLTISIPDVDIPWGDM